MLRKYAKFCIQTFSLYEHAYTWEFPNENFCAPGYHAGLWFLSMTSLLGAVFFLFFSYLYRRIVCFFIIRIFPFLHSTPCLLGNIMCVPLYSIHTKSGYHADSVNEKLLFFYICFYIYIFIPYSWLYLHQHNFRSGRVLQQQKQFNGLLSCW